jgi:hypothetical protein
LWRSFGSILIESHVTPPAGADRPQMHDEGRPPENAWREDGSTVLK